MEGQARRQKARRFRGGAWRWRGDGRERARRQGGASGAVLGKRGVAVGKMGLGEKSSCGA